MTSLSESAGARAGAGPFFRSRAARGGPPRPADRDYLKNTGGVQLLPPRETREPKVTSAVEPVPKAPV